MDSDDLEKILESSLEDENIIISDPSLFPCKLIWIVSNNSYITKHQIIAITTPIDTTTNTLTNGTFTKDTEHTEETPFGAIDAIGPSTVTGDTVMEKLERTIKSNKNGKLIKLVENLTLLNSETIIARIESFECDHDIIVHGLCTYCSEPIKRKLTSSLGFISNNSEVMIRDDLAYQMECNEILNYLNDKKLCLVLDLDNTLLHATSQPPPTDIIIPIINYNLSNYISNNQSNNQANNVSENISKNISMNISNGKYIQYGIDEKSIELQLELENSVIKTIVYNESETMFTNTYFKLRPGIFNFFHQIRDKFTLFLFTTGTKQHAESALQIIDPQLIYFSNRIFSRSHSNILNGVSNTVTVTGPTTTTVVPGTTKVPTNTTNSTTNTMNMAKGINLGTMSNMSNNMNVSMNTSHRNGNKKIDIKYYMKSLDKIFPNYKNLVIILDDTEHVWKDNLGLIKIHPYYFFPDLTYLNHFDLNNLTKSSSSLQSICNYSNFIWYKLLYTSIHNTSIHSNNYSNSNSNSNNNGVGKNVNEMDEEGFMIPNSIPIMNNEFRYNGYLICNQRPTNLFINNTTDKGTTNNNTSTRGTRGTIIDNRKMKIIDNDKQLDKIIKLLDNIHETFFQHYYSILHSINSSTNGTVSDTTRDTDDGEVTEAIDDVGPDPVTGDTVMGKKLKYMLDNELIPSASKILQEIRGKILKNVVLYSNTFEFINSNGLDVNFLSCSDFGKWSLKFGATISNTINTNTVAGIGTTNCTTNTTPTTQDTVTDTVKNINEVTHVIVNNKSNIKLNNSIKKVHIKWLEAVLYCHEYINEDKFNPDHWQIPYRSFWDILNS